MPQGQTPNSLLSLVFPFILIYGIFYFLIIRPQRKKEKEHQQTLSNLNKNDEIITVGGIHATIVNVKDKTIVARIDDNVKIELEKSSVVHVKSAQSTS
jgi:preprotein translocase subunit YajC